jgi:hypothetical protein
MGIANNAAGYMRTRGLMTGIGLTFVLLIIGVVMIAVGSMNANNVEDPNYRTIQLQRKGTPTRECRRGNNCRESEKLYVSTYDASSCKGMSNIVEKSSAGSGSITRAQHIESGECKIADIQKESAIYLIIFGSISTLLGLAAGYCTYREDCRGILGLMSIGGSMSGSISGMNNFY